MHINKLFFIAEYYNKLFENHQSSVIYMTFIIYILRTGFIINNRGGVTTPNINYCTSDKFIVYRVTQKNGKTQEPIL